MYQQIKTKCLYCSQLIISLILVCSFLRFHFNQWMSWFQVPFHMVFHGKSFITYFTLMGLFPLMNCQNMSSHWGFLSKWFLANITLKRLFPLMYRINMFVQFSFLSKFHFANCTLNRFDSLISTYWYEISIFGNITQDLWNVSTNKN